MKQKRDPAVVEFAKNYVRTFQPKTAEDLYSGFADVFGPIIEEMLQEEMDAHLGYKSYDHCDKQTENRRNGVTTKQLKSSYGDVKIDVPRDRECSFEPMVVPKRKRDIRNIEDRILALYAQGMSVRDIADQITSFYGCETSHDFISNVTDRVIPYVQEWQNRPLKPCYPFVYVDCLYVNVRKDGQSKNCAVYVVLAYDLDGQKDILGLWIEESESKHRWMQIFDELKTRGVEDIIFLCMDGVSGLEEGARSIFPQAKVQRCIVHLIRNSMRYLPSKHRKAFCGQLKNIYGAPNWQTAQLELEQLNQAWGDQYPRAVEVWNRHSHHVEQLFNYGSAIRKAIYTTNCIESINSSFRKVTKKSTFPNEIALYKVLYLRIQELYKKWTDRPMPNWAIVRNQLSMHDDIQARIDKYEKF